METRVGVGWGVTSQRGCLGACPSSLKNRFLLDVCIAMDPALISRWIWCGKACTLRSTAGEPDNSGDLEVVVVTDRIAAVPRLCKFYSRLIISPGEYHNVSWKSQRFRENIVENTKMSRPSKIIKTYSNVFQQYV